jgi:hypothetical protein
LAEFPFGTDHRADFVLMAPFSGGFDVQFIELEPPNEKLFTRTGTPAKRLAGALTQVLDWKIFVEKERHAVLRELSKFAEKEELLWKLGTEMKDNAGLPIHRPKAWINWYYHIVIGRRKSLSEVELGRKAALLAAHGVDVVTYDRLIDGARRLDQSDRYTLAEKKQPKNTKTVGHKRQRKT